MSPSRCSSMSRKSFHKGLELYKAENYQEALGHFNEAVDSGGPNLFQILDTRAAVYAKLGLHKEALKDAKKTIDIAPERWQGYARAARVFRQLGKVESAQTMITMALERVQETENERRASLLSFQAEIQSLQEALDMQRKRFIDHISQLPIEVFGEIARIAVEDDHTALIPLLHVCKRWRSVIENTPPLWAKLVLTSRRPQPKAKLWIERTKGKVKELVVKFGVSGWLGNALDGLQWDNLLVFQTEEWEFLPYLRSIGKEAAMTKWIGLTVENLNGNPIPLLRGQPGPFSLQSLVLSQVMQVDINGTKICEQINDLRSCTIRGCSASSGSWANVIKANPLLERLVVYRARSADPRLLPGILELDHLTTLEVAAQVPNEIFTARMPHLRHLTLRSPFFDPDVFIRHLTDTLVGGLTELKMHACRLSDSNGLLLLLRRSPNLQILEVTSLAVGVASLLNSLSAHYNPPSTTLRGDPPSDRPPILCPKLTHVNFSGCPEVQAGLLMRLIRSRLLDDQPAEAHVNFSGCPEVQAGLLMRPIESGLLDDQSAQTTSQTQPIEVAKIESLIIDSCPNVEKEWVKRMEELVPHVSCRYVIKKIARSRILV